jgi:hypothetical protein
MQTDNDRLYRSERAISIGCSYAIIAVALFFAFTWGIVELIKLIF